MLKLVKTTLTVLFFNTVYAADNSDFPDNPLYQTISRNKSLVFAMEDLKEHLQDYPDDKAFLNTPATVNYLKRLIGKSKLGIDDCRSLIRNTLNELLPDHQHIKEGDYESREIEIHEFWKNLFRIAQ